MSFLKMSRRQIVRDEGTEGKSPSLQELTEISRSLKNLAKELNVPVIAVSQLNRKVEKRSGNRKPQLSDLRESGAIEQDSDLVLFISREGTDDGVGAGDCTAEISIGKQRNGMAGAFTLTFRKRITKFENQHREES